jgi:hypothetical protein
MRDVCFTYSDKKCASHDLLILGHGAHLCQILLR